MFKVMLQKDYTAGAVFAIKVFSQTRRKEGLACERCVGVVERAGMSVEVCDSSRDRGS